MGIRAIEIEGGLFGLPHRGTAKVVDMGIDLDTMKRYVTYEFDPPTEDGTRRHTTTYSACSTVDGAVVPSPMSAKDEKRFVEHAAQIMGYDVDWNGWEV